MASGSSQYAKKNANVKAAVKERKAAEAKRTAAQARTPKRRA